MSDGTSDVSSIEGPSDCETELSVLGSMLADHRAMQDAKDLLNSVYFANRENGRIATIALELAKDYPMVTTAEVEVTLRQLGELEAVGGSVHLARIASRGRTRGLRGQILRLQDLYLRRVLIREARQIIERVSNVETGEKGFEALSATVGRLLELRHRVAKFMGGSSSSGALCYGDTLE